MALKEDYKDAVFSGLRKYKMLDNGDGTVSPVDMTEYEENGDKFGAKDVNAITKTVNATGEIIADDDDEFKPEKKYVIGDIVIYDNKTWYFKVDHEPGEWDESHVERTNILGEIAKSKKQCNELTEKIPSSILLWENPNPSQSMVANTVIELASDDYEWLEIYYKTSTTSSTTCYQKIRKGDSANLASTMFPSSDTAYGNRALTYVDDTHYKSGVSWISWRSSGINASAAAYTIPLAIYGIK